MSCCKKYLGEFPHDEDINIGIKATKAGLYKIQIGFGPDVKHKKETTLNIGDFIIIKRPFLESVLYDVKIIDPDGDFILSDDGCDNFTLKTYIQTNEECYGDICDYITYT